ncbi:MAG: HNH endonuclease [Chloroflexi bacterium]|nr:HNH endonuclease [Ardenticatenaceae bacterium]NOG33837.1 HNH endonuclease [Chloroflexota bacterium]
MRLKYLRACGYCGVTETSAGSELTIDHYQPHASGGTEADDNLVYACTKCNQYKHNFWPTAQQLAQGLRILHPLNDDISIHISANDEAGYLVALTPTGMFHINLLHLNRPQLVELSIV